MLLHTRVESVSDFAVPTSFILNVNRLNWYLSGVGGES